MWNRKTTVRLKNSVKCIVYTVPFHIWVDFECTGKICCFIPTLNTLINISSSYSTPSWVSLYVRKRYLSMVSWQNIEHSGGPGGAVFGTLYLLTVKKSSTWPLWPRCLPWPILINSSLNSHNSLFVSDSQNIKLQGYPQRMRLQRRLSRPKLA